MKLTATMLDRFFHFLADAPSDEAILTFYITPEEEERLAELAAISKQRKLNQQE